MENRFKTRTPVIRSSILALLFLGLSIPDHFVTAADETPDAEAALERCVGGRLALTFHPDRPTAMPDHMMVYRYFGKPDFNSASIIDLHASHGRFDTYTSGHMGVAGIHSDFQARGYVIENQFDVPGGLADVAAVLKSIGEPGMSLLDHNQTMPLDLMQNIKYLDAAKKSAELKSMAERNPNQVTFFVGTKSVPEDELKAGNNGVIPSAAYLDPYRKVVEDYFQMFADSGPRSENPLYVNPVGTSMLVSGQDLSRQYALQIETPDLKKPIPPDTIKFLVGRGAQIKPGSFREAFRGAAYYSYLELILLDSIKNAATHQTHLTGPLIDNAKMFAQVNSAERRDHFSDPEKYGFRVYSGYRDDPQKFALMEPLKEFVDGEGLEHFSAEVGTYVHSSGNALNGRQSLELLMDARQRATSYLTEMHQAHPQELQVRDFSSGLHLQAEAQVAKSVLLIPKLAAHAENVAWRLGRTDPISEYRDVAVKAVDASSRPYYQPVRGNEEPLRDFLEEQNAVEITPSYSLEGDPDGAKRILIGAYFEYLKKLEHLGVKNPVQKLIDSEVQFAVTTQGRDTGAFSGTEKTASWSVHREALMEISTRHREGSVILPDVHIRSDVFSVSMIESLIQANPKLASSVREEHPHQQGETHYRKFMSEPELFSP